MSFNSRRQPGFLTGLARATGAAAVLIVGAGMSAPYSYAEVGDLDPSFADHGRQVAIPGAQGIARSVELPNSGGVFVGGGRIVLARSFDACAATAASFAARLSENGGSDPAFGPAGMTGIEAMEVARQANGQIVGIGRKVRYSGFGGRCYLGVETLAAFRLNTDGSLDAGFGVGGIFDWDAGALSNKHRARSLLLETDGRIMITGTGWVAAGDTADSRLLVLRLLADGSLDVTFGDGGVFVGPTTDFGNDVRIARTQAGSYRVTSTGPGGCVVVGLTAVGTPDDAFGQGGVAPVSASGGQVVCTALDSQADGRLLLAGSAGMRGFVARLLSNGAPDPGFAPAATTSLYPASAITLAVDGSIFVAGSGPTGASITRLNSTGCAGRVLR